MSKKVKITIHFLIIAGGIILYFIMIKSFAPGSYANAEKYVVNEDESTLINALKKFKIDNPEYNVPEETSLKDGKDETGHWFFVYFYYPKENQIIETWTRQEDEDKNKTTFAFIGVNEGLILGHWKYINQDFNRRENIEEKKKFEERILNKLRY